MIKLIRKKYLMLILLLVLFVGCSSLQAKWDNLTPDQQASIVLNGLEDQLNLWFDAGKSYVTANPNHQVEWQTKVIPLFDLANQAIKDAVIYKKSPADIYATVSPTITKAITALKAWGVAVGS